MGPRASTKRSRTPSEDEGQSTEEDSPSRIPTEGRVSPSHDDVKTYNDDERPTAVAKESDAARATTRLRDSAAVVRLRVVLDSNPNGLAAAAT